MRSESRLTAIVGPGVVILVFFWVAIVTLQFYRQFIPNIDLLLERQNARALVQHGAVPVRGSVSSLYAFNPPGVSWALAPGILLFPTEAALAERGPALTLFGLALAGLYLLIARDFGPSAAVLACVVFSLSDRGLVFADYRWNRAHPLFLIWILYFTDSWVRYKRSQSLAAAVILWAILNYWMMEGITAIVIVAGAWITFHRPVRRRYMLLAAGVSLAIWMPYLVFETHRGFADLRANLTRTSMVRDFEAAFRNSLSNHALKTTEGYRRHRIAEGQAQGTDQAAGYTWVYDPADGWTYRATAETLNEGIRGKWTFVQHLGRWLFRPTGLSSERLRQAGRVWRLILLSMPESRVPGAGPILLFLLISSVWWGFKPIVQRWRRTLSGERSQRTPLIALEVFILLGGGLAISRGPHEFGLDRSEGLAFTAFWALSVAGLAALIAGLPGRLRFHPPVVQQTQPVGETESARFLLAIGAFLPWIITVLLMVNDFGGDLVRRFLWLWIVQGTLIMLFLLRTVRGRTLKIIALAALILIVALNDTCIYKTQSLFRSGFRAAPPNDFNNVIDYLGRRLRLEGRTSARIGYDVPFMKWIVVNHSVDGVSKVGDIYDIALEARYGITNLDKSAEGVAPDDEYRIVEFSSTDYWRQTYFDLTDYPRMPAIHTLGSYAVQLRTETGGSATSRPMASDARSPAP